MITKRLIVTIFGGSGFIGSNLSTKLAKLNVKINIIQSTLNEHDYSVLYGFPGQISYFQFQNNKNFYKKIFTNSDYIINLIGMLRESKNRTFYHTHVEIPKNIAYYASKFYAKKLIHISALGIDRTYQMLSYAKTKLRGENELLKNFPNATILRPSVVFGAKDKFINNLLKLANFSSICPLINNGCILSQPIYVENLTDIITKILMANSTSFDGKVFEIGGPDKVTLLEILNHIFKKLKKKPYYLPVNYKIMKLFSYLSKIASNFPITPEVVTLLLVNNIVVKNNIAKMLDITLQPISFYINSRINS